MQLKSAQKFATRTFYSIQDNQYAISDKKDGNTDNTFYLPLSNFDTKLVGLSKSSLIC